MKNVLSKCLICLFVFVLAFAFQASAAQFKPIVLDPNYSHDKWVTKLQDIVREFRAYTVSFDSNDGDFVLGVPETVRTERGDFRINTRC